jgi:hypothetical protein
MPNDIHVVYDDVALAAIADDPRVVLGADRLAGTAEAAMKVHCPVAPPGSGHPPGHLRDSIETERLPGGEYHIGPTADYGAYVNNGTPPHIIRSHGKWPLRGGGRVFGQVVHHPGYRGAHFIEEAARDIDGIREHL